MLLFLIRRPVPVAQRNRYLRRDRGTALNAGRVVGHPPGWSHDGTLAFPVVGDESIQLTVPQSLIADHIEGSGALRRGHSGHAQLVCQLLAVMGPREAIELCIYDRAVRTTITHRRVAPAQRLRIEHGTESLPLDVITDGEGDPRVVRAWIATVRAQVRVGIAGGPSGLPVKLCSNRRSPIIDDNVSTADRSTNWP